MSTNNNKSVTNTMATVNKPKYRMKDIQNAINARKVEIRKSNSHRSDATVQRLWDEDGELRFLRRERAELMKKAELDHQADKIQAHALHSLAHIDHPLKNGKQPAVIASPKDNRAFGAQHSGKPETLRPVRSPAKVLKGKAPNRQMAMVALKDKPTGLARVSHDIFQDRGEGSSKSHAKETSSTALVGRPKDSSQQLVRKDDKKGGNQHLDDGGPFKKTTTTTKTVHRKDGKDVEDGVGEHTTSETTITETTTTTEERNQQQQGVNGVVVVGVPVIHPYLYGPGPFGRRYPYGYGPGPYWW